LIVGDGGVAPRKKDNVATHTIDAQLIACHRSVDRPREIQRRVTRRVARAEDKTSVGCPMSRRFCETWVTTTGRELGAGCLADDRRLKADD
jgi:hypothetical protein